MLHRTYVSSACTALVLVLIPAFASALPGQNAAQFQTWSSGNQALHGLKKAMNQNTAGNYITATFTAGSTHGIFSADVDEKGAITDEVVTVDTSSETYDILKHLDVASEMLQTVYGASVSGDFKSAAVAGRYTLLHATRPTVLYRGKLYGYEANYNTVKLVPLSALGDEAKRLAGCAKTDCGD